MTMRRTLAASALLAAMLISAGGHDASAQAVDLDAYEQLFGEPVTASATGKPQRVSEAPVDMDVITADQISRSGARTLPDVLRYVAGLDVRSYGMQDQAVGIRGYNTPLSPRVLVLLDGQQVYLDDYGMTVWSAIPVAIDEIRQIEIIKGPNAALYGFNAVSGVINIITRNPLQHAQNVASIQGGTQSQSSGDAVGTVGTQGRWAVRLAAQGYRSTEFEGDEAGIERQQPHSGMVSIDSRARLTPTLEWDSFGSLASVDSALYVDIGDYVPVGIRTNTVRTGLSWDGDLGVVHVGAYRNEERLVNDDVDAKDSYRDDLIVVNVADLIKTGAHAFRIASEYRNNDAASFNTFRGHIGYQDVAASGMWEWTISPRVHLTNAVRTDAFFLRYNGSALDISGLGTPMHDSRLVEPSFNSGLVIRLGGQDTLLFSVARAAQLPSLLDYGFQYRSGPVIISGSTSLSPSEVTNDEVDWQHTLPRLFSRLRLSAFSQHTDSTVGAPFGSGYEVLPTGQVVFMARNFGSSDEVGGELELRGQAPSGLRWNLSYALAAVDDHSAANVLITASSVSYARQTPTSAVIAGLGYQWRRLDLDLQARWQSRYQDFRMDPDGLEVLPVTISNVLTVRLHAAYQMTRSVSLSLTADQLNRRQLMETAGVPTERQIYGGVRVSF